MTNTGQQNSWIANLLYCATFLGEHWHFEKKAKKCVERFSEKFLKISAEGLDGVSSRHRPEEGQVRRLPQDDGGGKIFRRRR